MLISEIFFIEEPVELSEGKKNKNYKEYILLEFISWTIKLRYQNFSLDQIIMILIVNII